MNPPELPVALEVVPSPAGPVRIARLDRLPGVDATRLARRPRTIRILLENLARHADRGTTDLEVLRALAEGRKLEETAELAFYPGRVLLQDFTGVPVVVDLTALRSAAVERGAGGSRVNPVVPVDLIVDHSVQVDSFGSPRSLLINLDREYERNSERYRVLRWAQGAYSNVRVVPPGNGIVHQVNLEHLASVVVRRERDGVAEAFPDTLVGTDSHTTMINGLGVLGWGVGGIEAEAVMMGEPYYLAPPTVVGVRLTGKLAEGTTATDAVLTVTRILREHGVVEKFVEFYGPGVSALGVPDRATISNMCPEYGATAALFPIDEATLAYLRATGRDPALVERVGWYARLQGLWSDGRPEEIEFDEHLEVNLARVIPTVSGPRNPEESVGLAEAPASFSRALTAYRHDHPGPNGETFVRRPYPSDDPLHPYAADAPTPPGGTSPPLTLGDGAVVIAAITSCTNTSNPSVMVGAGLIARRALARGLRPPPFVKTSLAPGSRVVTDYLTRAGLLEPLAQIGFAVVGYGCTTCIGNSGPLVPAVESAVTESDLYVVAVLSGNRNFEARIHTLVRANYLASPMLVVAYALAGRFDIDLTREPVGTGSDGRPVYLKDLWPTAAEVRAAVESSLDPELFRSQYRSISKGDRHWEELDVPVGEVYPWEGASTYLREPPYFEIPPPPAPTGPTVLSEARVLLALGDRVSTDHISPAGEIARDGPAGRYLAEHGVPASEFNTYGSRRGNHEVMVRGTFANVRLKNLLVAPTEGGHTVHLPSGDALTVYEAAERYRAEKVPLVVLAGSSYGQGSSRDWAAKGPLLLGVRAVLAESYERIHRSNLVGMGVLPLQFRPGEGWRKLGLTGRERISLVLPAGRSFEPRGALEGVAIDDAGRKVAGFELRIRIDSPQEMAYYRAGGLLPYVLGRLAAR